MNPLRSRPYSPEQILRNRESVCSWISWPRSFLAIPTKRWNLGAHLSASGTGKRRHGARSGFRANLSCSSSRRFHQISFPSNLVRTVRIELTPERWQRSTPTTHVRNWWVAKESNLAGVLLRSRPLPELNPVGSGGRNRTDYASRHQGMSLISARCSSPRQWCRASISTAAQQFVRACAKKVDVSIAMPDGTHPFERGPGALPVDLPSWRKAAGSIRSASRAQPASNRCRPPGRFTFLEMAESGRTRIPCLAAPFAFKATPGGPPGSLSNWS
jgi:hypothetical protein